MTSLKMPSHYFIVSTFLVMLTLMSAASGQHECDRVCVENERPRTCYYNMEMIHYAVLSKACFNCPQNSSDCLRPHCITANGLNRSITVMNKSLPGPAIAVCHNDLIVVDVVNRAGAKETTIHWHGQNQVGSPHMDGVPFVTQCPILGENTFRYTFRAAENGTFFWHSHMGFQRTDGVNGPLIVRQPLRFDPNSGLYDQDLTEHYVMIHDWINLPGESMLYRMHHGDMSFLPTMTTILANGKGRVNPFTDATTTQPDVPLSVFNVRAGVRYRFRVCNNGNLMCAVQMFIDSHDLTVIAADGDSIQPRVVRTIVLGAGERFDFVLNANQTPANYWIKFRGVLACSGSYGTAILRYQGSGVGAPVGGPLNVTGMIPTGVVLNPVNSPNLTTQVGLLDMVSNSPPDPALRTNPDQQFYIPFDLVVDRDPVFFDPVLYPWDDVPRARRLLLGTIDNIAFGPPPSPLLSQYNNVPQGLLCNSGARNCTAQFCRCVHLLRVRLNAVVEFILIDRAILPVNATGHPFHLHGHHFWVVGQGFGANSVEAVQQLDREGRIRRNLERPVKKDTAIVPSKGFVVLRFHATNPGFWLFHCHVEFHSDIGMTLVVQVGQPEDMVPTPSGFPTCGNYLPPIPSATG